MSLVEVSQAASSQEEITGGGESGLNHSPLGILPEEILIDIFTKIPVGDVHQAALACRSFHRLAHDTKLFCYWDEMQLCRTAAIKLLIGETNELTGNLMIQKMTIDAEDNHALALRNRALFVKQLIQQSSLEKLAQLNLDAIAKDLKAKRIKHFLQCRLLQRWRVLIDENTDHQGCLLLPWFLKFNPCSFRFFLKGLHKLEGIEKLVINMPMNSQLMHLLDEAVPTVRHVEIERS